MAEKETEKGNCSVLATHQPPLTRLPKGFYLFNNLETQGAALTYAWKGEIYTYEDGQVYQMAPDQAAHLNTLFVNRYDTVSNELGQLKSKVVGRTKRFSVTEVAPGEVTRLRQEMAANS